MAGGRLAIDLKDAPVAYSVLNKEFLDALQITGLEQAADWAPNTTRVPDHGHENTWGGSVLVSSRGVSSFFAQRDFFQMQMDFDSYNLDRFDYGRGPNAVLFGFASFGGTLALREWWQLDPPGTPHTFDIVLNITGADGEPASAAFVQDVIDAVNQTKPARSHFTFTQGVNASGGLGLKAVARPATFARVQSGF